MELSLSLQDDNQVQVDCDRHNSHSFALQSIPTDDDPEVLGISLFSALFPSGSPAHVALGSAQRLALVLEHDLDAIPWEFLRGPEGFLALEMPLVRLISPARRQPMPRLDSTSLQVLAVPSNPVAHDMAPLNIAGEWRRLREIIEKLTHKVWLERVNPPTLDNLRQMALTSPQSVIHFMGHGGHMDGQALLFFENDAGGLQSVTAKDFALSVGKQVSLVTLNACVSATPGATEFSNLARLLVERGVPYALGMRYSIPDGDALTFSHTLYTELASGIDVEQAVFQARRSLLRDNPKTWLVGVPVLYSSLKTPAGGFATPAGQPQVNEHQPQLEVIVLPRAEGAFQGRVDELLTLGQALTGEPRPKLLTIHGTGGQGKTALAREAVERFAHAWPGGVWAISLENKPTRAAFCFQLAQFLKLPTQNFPRQADLERVLLAHLETQRLLLVLDNAETFTEAVRAEEPAALDLAQLLKEGLLGTAASLLVTSREPLGWPGEQSLALKGLSRDEGAALFAQSAPQRRNDIQLARAKALSAHLDGHPLALLLLGLTFNETSIALDQFIAEHETHLLNAENRYKTADHRHRTLYASIETSTRYLDDAHRALLSGLWILQSPFLPEAAEQIFTPLSLPEAEVNQSREAIAEKLHALFRRGLLVREVETRADGNFLFYRMLPTVRLFAQHYLKQIMQTDDLYAQMGWVYANLLEGIGSQMDRSSWASYLAVRCREDLEACANRVKPAEQGHVANRLGTVLMHIGDRQAGLRWLEWALERAQSTDQNLESVILGNMAALYGVTGQPSKALELYEKALSIKHALSDRDGETTIYSNMAMLFRATGQLGKALEFLGEALLIERVVGNRAGEASTLNNMGMVYHNMGQPDRALELYEEALPIERAVGNWTGEASILNNIGEIYRATGQPGKALELYEQALTIYRAVGDQQNESVTLNNIAAAYDQTGQLEKAFEFSEQALRIKRAVGDRAGEAKSLNLMAGMYYTSGHPDKALELNEQAMHLMRAVGDREGEAVALSNMAVIYNTTGQPDKALELSEQALLVIRAIGDRVGEEATLKNIANVYLSASQPEKALELFKQALLIERAVGNWTGEASILNNIGEIYRATGQPGKALELYEQALPLMRAVGNRAGEAATLNNMAIVYNTMGQSSKALELNEQGLVICRAIGNREGEAAALNNMADLYGAIGQPSRALELFEQALPLMRAVGNRAGEAATLNNMAVVYNNTGQPGKALELHEQVLPIRREVGNRAGEATTLNNIGEVYRTAGRPDKALELYEQALPLMREVGNQAGEAATINNMAMIYGVKGHPDKALELYEQALSIRHAAGDREGEAVTCCNMALLLRDMGQAERAIEFLRRGVLLEKQGQYPGYPQSSALLIQWETAFAHGEQLPSYLTQQIARLPPYQVQRIAANTLAVLIKRPEKCNEFREIIARLLSLMQASNMHAETEFLTAIIILLDGQKPNLTVENPYAGTLRAISQSLASGDYTEQDGDIALDVELAVQAYLQASDLLVTRQIIEQYQEILFGQEAQEFLGGLVEQAKRENSVQTAEILAEALALLQVCRQDGIEVTFAHFVQDEPQPTTHTFLLPAGLPADFVWRCVAGLNGSFQDKQALLDYLTNTMRKTSVPEAEKLVKNVQMALVGQNPTSLDTEFAEPYTAIWQEILSGLSGLRGI